MPKPPLFCWCIALVCLICTACRAQDLFVDFDGGEAVLSDLQQHVLARLRAGKGIEVLRLVRVDTRLLDRESVVFNLTPVLRVRCRRTAVEPGETGGFSWHGKLDESGAAALLVVRGDSVTGTVETEGAVYQVRPLGEGLHAIVRLDPSKFPPDHPRE